MEEGDLLLCTVKEVTNTITTVELPNGQEATIISSEIAPGRIKLMRQYVVPNKKIVCKILDISGNNVHLSLRRVNSKEKKEVMQKWKIEQASKVAFKQILGEDAEEIKEKIEKEFSNIDEFLSEAKKNNSLLKKFIPENKIEAIKKITEKRKGKQELKHSITIKCLEDDGVTRIKKIFDLKNESASVTYISAGKFKLKLTVDDFKEGKKEMAEIVETLEKRAKENNCEFYATEEK